MKRSSFLRHLHRHGCELLREGKAHTLYWNPANGQRATVPRHIEIRNRLAKEICEQLGIPAP